MKMKTAQVDFVFCIGAVRMPDGTLAGSNTGEIKWWMRESVLLSIPDTATSQDVLGLGEDYLYALAENLVGVEWEELGDSEGSEVFENGVSAVLTEDDPVKANVELTIDEDAKLAIKDEELRWEVTRMAGMMMKDRAAFKVEH
jgi:hypothetical protein